MADSNLGFTVRSTDIVRCPLRSLSPAHYRHDGSCLCDGWPLEDRFTADMSGGLLVAVDNSNNVVLMLGPPGGKYRYTVTNVDRLREVLREAQVIAHEYPTPKEPTP